MSEYGLIGALGTALGAYFLVYKTLRGVEEYDPQAAGSGTPVIQNLRHVNNRETVGNFALAFLSLLLAMGGAYTMGADKVASYI